MRDHSYWVYMLTNPARTVLYTGVTNNLIRRIATHKSKRISGFSKRYNLTLLVYYEETSDIRDAIEREKQIKGWIRDKKNALITDANPTWTDLATDLV